MFPEMYPAAGTKRAIGDVFYQIWWMYLRPMVPFLKRGRAMHSVRHTASDALKDAGFDLEKRNDFFGWSQKDLGEGASRYGSPTVLDKMKAMVETIPVVTCHLQFDGTIHLLPIEKRQPRPGRA